MFLLALHSQLPLRLLTISCEDNFTGLNSRIVMLTVYIIVYYYGSTNFKSQKSGESSVGMLKCVMTSEYTQLNHMSCGAVYLFSRVGVSGKPYMHS